MEADNKLNFWLTKEVRNSVACGYSRNHFKDARGLMPPRDAGLVPKWCKPYDKALQLLGLYQPLHIDWLPT